MEDEVEIINMEQEIPYLWLDHECDCKYCKHMRERLKKEKEKLKQFEKVINFKNEEIARINSKFMNSLAGKQVIDCLKNRKKG